MKKLIILTILSFVLFSCGNSSDKEEKIRKEIKKYKSEITDLEGKIKKLEAELGPANNIHATKVRVMKLKREPFSKYFEATGELEAVNEVYISPEMSGQIVSVDVVEGEKVNKGQVVARLNANTIEKNIDEVKTQLNLAKTIYDKQSQLWNKGIGSERQYLEAKNNYESLKDKLASLNTQYEKMIIRSPINGVVEDIILEKGELATPGMQMMMIVDLDHLKVSAMLSEKYLPVVKEGDSILLTFPTYPDIELKRRVTRTGNVINKQNRTFLVEVEIKNEDSKLKPNQLANIKINDYNNADALVVPSLVIREDIIGPYLYIAEKNSETLKAVKKYIQTGHSYKNETEVLSGLSANDLIITDGYSNVSDGVPIEIVK